MKRILLLIVISLTLAGCSLPWARGRSSALRITSEPGAKVFLNDQESGTTPFFSDTLKPGEYTVKLTLENNPNTSWETKITLKPQLETGIVRTFGPSETESSHYILRLEEIGNKDKAEFAAVSIPDSAVVKIDNQPVGFTPATLKEIEPGDHEAIIGSPGYKQLTIPFKAQKGFKVIISLQLAKEFGLPANTATPSATLTQDATPSASPKPTPKASPKTSPTPTPKSTTATGSGTLALPYVKILDTPTGFLKVRSEPDATKDNVLTQVNPGQTFPFIEKNTNGWFKIEYQKGKQGWVSGQYAQLYQ